MKLLGHQHPSKPQTDEDRAMSVRHLAARAKVDHMQPTPATLQKSIQYNKAHADEHMKAIEDRKEDLEEAREDRAKAVDKLAKKRAKK